MATSNTVAIPHAAGLPTAPGGVVNIQNRSISFTSSAGLNVSNSTVPAGLMWLVYALRLSVTDTGATNNYEFYFDDGATSHGCMHDPGGAAPTQAGSNLAGMNFGWTGQLWLPAGWRVGIKLLNCVGGIASNNWQFMAFEFQL
jgi:hypothetical protein